MSFLDRIKKRRQRRSGTGNGSSQEADNDLCSPTELGLGDGPSFLTGGVLKFTEEDHGSSPPDASTPVFNPKSPPPSARSFEGDIGAARSSGKLKKRSRLRKNLKEALDDPGGLAYFLQYLDSIHKDHLVKFWLEAESFRVSTLSTLNYAQKNSTTRSSHNNGETDDAKPSRGIREMTSQDAVNIFTRFFGSDSPNFIGVPESITKSVMEKICGEDGKVDPCCFIEAQSFVFQILDKRYFPDFLGSVHYCKHQLDVLTEASSSVTLSDVIFNDSSLSFFTEFLDLCGGVNYLEFWLTAESFRNDLLSREGSYSAEQAQTDAMVFYDKYFSMQATHSLGFDENIRVMMEQNICREEGPLPECFDVPHQLAWIVLDQKYLKPFLRSGLFRKYLDDLVHTIENSLELPDPEGRGRSRRGGSLANGSDASSGGRTGGSLPVFSRSKISTLLAAQESPSSVAKRRQKLASESSSTQSLDIETTQGVWEKNRAKGGLSFGRVNSLGHYVSEVHSSPEPPSGKQKFTQKVSKLISSKDAEEEARIAAQVAEMIINDVKNMAGASDSE